jgi:hypothetical protein
VRRLASRDFDARLAELEERLITRMAQLEAGLLKRLDSHFQWLVGVEPVYWVRVSTPSCSS